MFGTGSVWGLDLAESGLKAVRMSKKGGRLLIEDFQIIRYAEITSDSEVRKEDLFRLAVRQFLPHVGKAGVIVGIPSENVLSRFISLPPVEKRRIHDIVQYEARQQIPFDLNEVLWDYERVQEEYLPGEEIDIGLFAVRREHINQYLEDLRPLGGALKGLQTSPLAAYSFVRTDLAPEEPIIVVDIGAKTTDLIVIEGAKFWMRNLRVAGNSFTQALQRKFNITFEDAENVKRHMARSKHRARIFEVMQPVAQELVSEIQRSIGYYKSLSREAKFEEILVLGDAIKLYGLHRFISERLQYRIRVLDELKDIEVAEEKREGFQKVLPGMAAAVGLAMHGLGQSAVSVELLPEDFVIRRELSRKKMPALAAAVLLWIAFGLLWFSKGLGAGELTRMKDIGRDPLARSRQLQTQYRQARAAVNVARINNLLGLRDRREIWAHLIKGVTDAIPKYIYISGLDFGARTAAAEAAPAAARLPMEGGPGAGEEFEGPGMGPSIGGEGMESLTFSAYTDARNPPIRLGAPFQARLEDAHIWPERIKIFTNVLVPPKERITLVTRAAANIDPDRTGGGSPEQRFMKVDVLCELKSEETLRTEREKVRAGKRTP